MSFERNMDIGKKGYCLVKGHPAEHTLEVSCWGKLRDWLFHNPHGSQQQYINECKRK